MNRPTITRTVRRLPVTTKPLKTNHSDRFRVTPAWSVVLVVALSIFTANATQAQGGIPGLVDETVTPGNGAAEGGYGGSSSLGIPQQNSNTSENERGSNPNPQYPGQDSEKSGNSHQAKAPHSPSGRSGMGLSKLAGGLRGGMGLLGGLRGMGMGMMGGGGGKSSNSGGNSGSRGGMSSGGTGNGYGGAGSSNGYTGSSTNATANSYRDQWWAKHGRQAPTPSN